MDHAIDHCNHMLRYVHDQSSGRQFFILEMHLTAGPDHYRRRPLPPSDSRTRRIVLRRKELVIAMTEPPNLSDSY